MENNIFNKVHLLVLKLLELTTPQEEQELQDELAANESFRQLIESLKSPDAYNERQELLRKIDTEKELDCFLKKHRQNSFRLSYWLGWAAILLLFIGSGTTWYLFHTPSLQPLPQQTQTIHPGTRGAVLTLSDGSIQILQEQSDHIMEADGRQISNDFNQLNYTTISAPSDTITRYNHLLVGRGLEYMLVLHDGTRVWMNSESELHYPVQFAHTTRRVRLSGEAYFEVAPDVDRPFIVEVNEQFEVKVLGTHFNIKAYPTDDHAETTLVSGKVAVSRQTDPATPTILRPSEQAIIKENQEIAIQKVKIDYHIAWHEGWFYFNNERLEKALEQIGRWYDVQFDFTNPQLRELMVTGKIKRFENLDVILNMLSTTTHCKYLIDQKTIHVSK